MIVGHQQQWQQLQAWVHTQKLHHAQLFLGPKHVGKTTVATELSLLLQGVKVGDPATVILKKQILEGLNADTFFYCDNGEALGIETIRHIVERAQESHALPALIFVLENIGRMKPEAANALLKTLEEPLRETYFFLTAHYEDDVLPTIASRCHITHFQTVSDALLREAFSDQPLSDEHLFFAMGRPGKLKRLLEDLEFFQSHQQILQDLTRFLENPTVPGVYELIRKYEEHPLLFENLDILLERGRTWLLAGRIPQVLQAMNFPDTLDKIEDSKMKLTQHINTKLVLENLLLPFVP